MKAKWLHQGMKKLPLTVELPYFFKNGNGANLLIYKGLRVLVTLLLYYSIE